MLLSFALLSSFSVPAAAIGVIGTIQGHVTDAATGAPIANACMWIGPVLVPRSDQRTNCTFTDGSGFYTHSWVNSPARIDLHFEMAPVYQQADAQAVVNQDTPVTVDVVMTRAPGVVGGGGGGGGAPPPAPTPPPVPAASQCTTTGDPTATLYLPNVTKTLGGPDGWQTPFIVQNVGSADTVLEVSFFRFADGSLVTCRQVRGLRPGTSFADVPNNDFDLPDDAQFSVVVRSFGSAVVSVVNEHRGAGNRAEALSYVATSRGSAQVSVPWFSKLANNWLTTMVIQNLGTVRATVTINAMAFDGRTSTTISRVIEPGRSQFVDPRVEAAFKDGYEYTLQLVADQPISAVVNAHQDDPSVAAPRAMSYNGAPAGTTSPTYLPYVPRSADGAGRNTRVIVQNRGQSTVTPTATLRSLATGAATVYTPPLLLPPASAWVFDPTMVTGLSDGEYSLEIGGGTFVAVAGITDATSAMAYASSAPPSQGLFLPNVTRTLGGPAGWTTPIVVQSAGATSITLTWYRFSDGSRVFSQTLPALAAGAAIRIDPRAVTQLSDDRQYAVVLSADGPVRAVVTELNFSGGDGAMAYEAIP